MADCSIGIRSAPGQDGSTIANQIASPDQMAAHGTPDREDEKGLKGRRSCRLPAFAHLGRAGNAQLASGVEWQATGQSQSRPTGEPLMHVLRGESPQRFEQSDEQQRRFVIRAGATACAFGQRRWAAPMRELNRQATQRQQVQAFDQAEGIDM
ncbi:MAG: hypothetical protein ACXVCM_15810 [Ktedonobacteraceae bacterium]